MPCWIRRCRRDMFPCQTGWYPARNHTSLHTIVNAHNKLAHNRRDVIPTCSPLIRSDPRRNSQGYHADLHRSQGLKRLTEGQLRDDPQSQLKHASVSTIRNDLFNMSPMKALQQCNDEYSDMCISG